MKVTVNTAARDRILDQISSRLSKPRYGIHVSDLTGCLRKSYYRRVYNIKPTTEEILYWSTGRGLHQFLETRKTSEVTLVVDDTISTVDSVVIENSIIIPEEIKTTRLSSNKTPTDPKMAHWISQCLSYAYIWKTNTVRLIALHIVGAWKPPVPELICYDLEFTQEEIEANWEIMMLKKQILQGCLVERQPPSTKYKAWETECEFCGCKKICEEEPE